MQTAKFRDLIEGQSRIFHQPDGSGFRHQGAAVAHGCPLSVFHAPAQKPLQK
jgi:hypothetical protein